MKSKERVQTAIRCGMCYTLAIMLAGFVGLEIFARPFAGLFGLSGETADLCVSAIRIISVSYLFAGANVAYQGIFQALDGGLESLIVSVCRQFVLVVPVAWIFSKMVTGSGWPVWSVWLTFIIAEGVSAGISVIFMKKIKKKKNIQ